MSQDDVGRYQWGDEVQVPALAAGAAGRTRLIYIPCDDEESSPQIFSLNLSGSLDPALAAPFYEITVGVGRTKHTWTALAAGPYVVAAHSVEVRAIQNVGAVGIWCRGWAAITPGATPTLVP